MAEFKPVPVEPGTPNVDGASPGAGRPARPVGLLRWGVALVVVALVVGLVSVGTIMLTSGSATSTVEGWIPAGTVLYLEGRADLPGDQRQNVGNIIAKFPGFKDQASLDAKIDQALDQALQKSGMSWTTDLKPWVAGEVGVAVTRDILDLAAAARKDPSAVKAPDRGAVVLASVKDAAAATAWVAKQAGGAPSTTTYGDGQITTVAKGGTSVAWATRGTVLLLGPEASVKAALDTKGASPVAASTGFVAARKAAPSAYLGFAYIDTRALVDALVAMGGTTGNIPQACTDSATSAVPDWAAGFAHAADAALVMDLVAPAGSGPSTPGAGGKDTPSSIAAHLPGNTLVAVEGREAGAAIVALWSGLKAGIACDPSMKRSLDQVDTALAAIGGPESLFGWAGDAAIAVEYNGGTFGGGIAAVATNEAAATRTLGQVQAVLALGGAGAGISTRTEAYGGGSLLIVTLPGQASGMTVPQIAATVQKGVFVLGTLDFVKHVVDTSASSSLSTTHAYTTAISAAGGDGVSDLFVDISGVRAAVEAMLPAAEKTRYETDVKPFLEPFDAFASVTKVPGATRTIRQVLVFK
jgi:hypothetical protein